MTVEPSQEQNLNSEEVTHAQEDERIDTGDTPKEEPEAPKEETKEEDYGKFSKSLRTLAERERKIAAKEKRVAEQLKEIERYKRLETIDDPYEKLKAFGADPKTLIKSIVEKESEPDPGSLEYLQMKLERLEKEREAERAQHESARKAEAERERREKIQAEIDGFKGLISETVTEKASSMEFLEGIEQPELEETVFEICAEHFRKTSEVMHPSDALAKLNAHLEKQAEKLLNSNWITKRFNKDAKGAEAKGGRPSPTLTNKLASQSGDDSEISHLDPDAAWEAILRRNGITG